MRHARGRFWLLGSAATVSLILSSPAFGHGADEASETAAPSAPSSAEGSATADSAVATQDEAQSGVTDILITAQRRQESLQDAALAVSAVEGDALIDAGVTDVTQLGRLVPSLVVQPSVGAATAFYVRGVGSFVGNAFTENPVAFNYGQVYIARPAALLGTFYDIERVEVLRGPQGTLYGRNATGGAVNVIPRSPELGEFGGNAIAEYGNYNAVRVQGALNVPLGEIGAFRVAANFVDRDGYLSDGYDDEEGQAVRVSVLVEPNDSIRAVIFADYFHQGGNGAGSVLVPGPLVPNAPDPDDRIGGADPLSAAVLRAAFPPLFGAGLVLPPQTDGFIDSEFFGVSANLDIDLGFATLTLIPAYRDSNPNYLTYNGGYRGRVDEESRQTTFEARLASNDSNPLEYVLGAYYFDEDQIASNNFSHGPILATNFAVNQQIASYAVFGEASYEILSGFRLAAGARYTWEDRTNDTTLTQTQFGRSVTSTALGDLHFERFTWKLGFEWDAGPENLVYGSVATGFKSGGFFIAALDNTFGPETLTAFTLGSKNRFIDNRLQINLELFYWDYNDQQVNHIGPVRTSPTTIGAGLRTTNAGSSRMYGVEAEASFQVTPNILLSANVQYLNGKYTDFQYIALSATGAPPRTNCGVTPSAAVPVPLPARAFAIDCSGRPQINAPDWTINLSYEHTFPLSPQFDLVFGARTRIETGRFLLPEYLPEEFQDSYMQSDLILTLRDLERDVSISAFVNNLEDETVYGGSSLRPIVPVVYNILRAPRTYGVRVAANF